MLFHDVGLGFRGLDGRMPHRFRDDADVEPVFQQMHDKRKTEGKVINTCSVPCQDYDDSHRLLKPRFQNTEGPDRSAVAGIYQFLLWS